MSKAIIYDENSRKKLQDGVNQLANAVRQTLGPKGKYVIIDQSFGSPMITNDGVTIARSIELEDPFENMGAKLVKEVSSKTEELSGDGTTTATILTQSILNQGLRYVNNGASPRFVKKGIELTTSALVKELKDMAFEVSSQEDIKNIASVSAKNEEIGTLISSAIEQVTKNGVITVEEGKQFATTVDIVNGYHFDRGYASPYMASDQKTMTSTILQPYIMLYNQQVGHINELLPVLEKVLQTGKELIVIAKDFNEEVVSTIVMNRLRGLLNVTLIKAPGFGDDMIYQLEDLSHLLKTPVYDQGDALKSVTLEELGVADKVEVKKNQTIIMAPHNEEMNDYIEMIKQSQQTNKDKRIAKLVGGIGVINVGGSTETEVKEKKMRIEDALQSTRAAMDEGIVEGGGLALLKAMSRVHLDDLNEDEQMGYRIVEEAIKAPFMQIVENCGLNGHVALQTIKSQNYQVGFDALDETYKDLIKAGILDPLKNIRIALENATSIASLILMTSVAVVDAPKTLE